MKSESALALDLAAALLQNALPDAIGPAFRTDLSQHLLRTPPAERPARKRDLQAAIADVDETINSVRAIHDVVTLMLNTLLRKRTALHHALQSPVHALPTEILQRIFSMLVYEARETDIAIALTHVCSSWRFVALGSGRLWEHVRARTTSSLSELVGRSAPHQFSLELQLSFILGLPEAPSGLPKIQLHPENARRLNLLCLSDPSVLRHLDFPDAAALPNLGGLQLEAGLSLDMTHFPSLPSGLTSVLNILIQNWDRPRCFMNNGSWPRLMSICFQSSSVTSVSRVLDEMIAPCLTTLFFVTMMDDYWTGSLDIMTQGPHSVNSVIIVDSSRFVYSFGRNFHLFPNLTSFTVVRLDEESRYSWVTLLQWLPHVTKLTVVQDPDDLDDLIDLAMGLNGPRRAPKLETLSITRLLEDPRGLNFVRKLLIPNHARIPHTSDVNQDSLDDMLPFVDDTNASTNPVAVALAVGLRQRMETYGLPRLRLLVLSPTLGGGDSSFFWGLADAIMTPAQVEGQR